MSSMTEPICGNSSQISRPVLPNFWNVVLRAKANQLLPLQLGELLPLGQALGHRLAVHLGELGLVIEGFQMRRAAGHASAR